MKHIVDNVNNPKITFKILDLAGRVPFTDSIELLGVELQYRDGRGPLFMGRVQYAIDGVKQEEGFPLDLHKGAFIATVRIQEAGLEDKLQAVGPDIARIVYEDLAAQRRALSNSVLEKITEIAEKSATGDYIYRGESKCHGKVRSALYREYETDIEAENFDIAVVQEEILREAREYTTHKMDDLEILTELQHHGGKTNLIDFTTDYLVALFFACDGNLDKSGRVILLQNQSGDYEVVKPPRTITRAGDQKSIFVQAPKGIVAPDIVVCIPANLKENILDYLQKHHDISTKTIYNDLHGYIENRRIHKSAYTEFYKGATCQDRGDSTKNPADKRYDKAIKHYTEAIDLNPKLIQAYNNRGNVYRSKDKFDAAIQDYNTAIALNPEFAEAYNNRGAAYGKKGELDRAIQDYNIAIALNPELADTYSNRGYIHIEMGNLEIAIQDYNRAIELKSNDAETYNNRGTAYYRKGEFDAAIQDYNTTIALNPEFADVYSNRGEALLHLREWEKAKADLITAKNMGVDIVASFHNEYESIEDFETKHGVEVPEDIAALLRRD